jgi:uncharacterized protein
MSGSLVHFEIPSRDTGRAKAFWGGVFDWSFNDPGMGMEYWMTRTGENQGGAIFAADQPGVIVYFDTDDIDATIARIQELGGTASEKSPIPQVGWFARCTDTDGNAFSLFQSDETVPA